VNCPGPSKKKKKKKTMYKTFSLKSLGLERLCFSSLIFGSCKLRL
jgi:hypothetical protein